MVKTFSNLWSFFKSVYYSDLNSRHFQRQRLRIYLKSAVQICLHYFLLFCFDFCLKSCPKQPGPASTVEERLLCNILRQRTLVRNCLMPRFFCTELISTMRDHEPSKNVDVSLNLELEMKKAVAAIFRCMKENIAR